MVQSLWPPSSPKHAFVAGEQCIIDPILVRASTVLAPTGAKWLGDVHTRRGWMMCALLMIILLPYCFEINTFYVAESRRDSTRLTDVRQFPACGILMGPGYSTLALRTLGSLFMGQNAFPHKLIIESGVKVKLDSVYPMKDVKKVRASEPNFNGPLIVIGIRSNYQSKSSGQSHCQASRYLKRLKIELREPWLLR